MHELSWNKQHINRYNQSYQSELDSSLIIPYGFDVVGSLGTMEAQNSVHFRSQTFQLTASFDKVCVNQTWNCGCKMFPSAPDSRL